LDLSNLWVLRYIGTGKYHNIPVLESTRTVRYDATIPSLCAHRTMDEASLHWVLPPRRVPYITTKRYRMWHNVTMEALTWYLW
jgi:hypothetical protein